MANKNVVREDVVQIKWEVQKNPFKAVKGQMNQFKSAVADTVKSSTSGFEKVGNSTKKVQPDMKKLKELAKQATSALKKMAATSFNKLNSALTSVGKKITTVTKNALSSLGQLAKKIATVSAALVGSLGVVGVKYNATMETYQTSFEVMTGSAKKAQQVVKDLKKLGASTPFEMPELADTTQLMMNYGFTADDAISRLKMLGDIAQGDAEKLNGIATAYGQMNSAGKVSLEDVKQMIERGFNPLQEISKTTGESMTSLYDRISKGKISVDEITQSMIRSTSEGGKYFQSMEKQSKTFEGQLSTMKDNFQSLLGSITKGFTNKLAQKVFPEINMWLGRFGTAFDRRGFDGLFAEMKIAFSQLGKTLGPKILEAIPKVAKSIGIFFGGIVSYVKENKGKIISTAVNVVSEVAEALYEGFTGKKMDASTFDQLKSKIQGVANTIANAASWIVNNFNKIVAGVKAFAAVFAAVKIVSAIVKIVSFVQKAIGVFNKLKTAFLAIKTAFAAIKAFVVVFAKGKIAATVIATYMKAVMFAQKAVSIFGKLKTAFTAIKTAWTAFNTAIGIGSGPLGWIIVGVVAAIAALVLLIKNWDKVKAAVGIAVDWMKNKWDGFKTALDGLVDYVGGLKDKLLTKGKEMIQGLIDGINSKIKDTVDAVKGIGTKIVDGVTSFFKIGSPSKLMKEKFQFVMDGAVVGIKDKLSAVQSVVGKVNNAVGSVGGYTPQATASSTSSSVVEHNSYSPQFNLNITGGSMSDRELATKVKGWMKECMDEYFASMSRRNPRLTEV